MTAVDQQLAMLGMTKAQLLGVMFLRLTTLSLVPTWT